MYFIFVLKNHVNQDRGAKKSTWSENCLGRIFLDFKLLMNKYTKGVSWHATDCVECGNDVTGSRRVGIQKQSGWQNACLWTRCARCHAHRCGQDLEEPWTSFKGLQRKKKNLLKKEEDKCPSLSFSLFELMVFFFLTSFLFSTSEAFCTLVFSLHGCPIRRWIIALYEMKLGWWH